MFIKPLIFAATILIAGYAQAQKPQTSAVILMYHHFSDDTPASTSVTLQQFDAHLEYLEENNFNVWPLSKLINHWQNQKEVPDRTVVLTADDAYKSVYENAFPRLKQRGWSMTTFVNAEPIDKQYRNFMTWEQMREMQQQGFEFANHTLSHSALHPQANESTQEFKQRVRHEVKQGQKRLQQELGADTNQSPKLFAYPYGEYNELAANLIKELGYVSVAQVSGAVDINSDRRALNRFPMAVRFAEINDFRLKVNTRPLPIAHTEPFESVISENPPKLRLQFNAEIPQLNCFNSRGEPLQLTWLNKNELEIQSKTPLNPPRDRYACTAPSGKGYWYWWGHPWIIPAH